MTIPFIEKCFIKEIKHGEEVYWEIIFHVKNEQLPYITTLDYVTLEEKKASYDEELEIGWTMSDVQKMLGLHRTQLANHTLVWKDHILEQLVRILMKHFKTRLRLLSLYERAYCSEKFKPAPDYPFPLTVEIK